MTKIKICGLKRKEDILYVNKYKPDYIGFVFAEKSKRKIDKEKAKELKSYLDNDIKSVGVFLNQDIDFILDLVNSNIIDLIQLHGNEDSNYIKELRSKTNKEIIKAYRIDENANYVLYDNIEPGSGEVFDWSEIKNEKPFFLAGGIGIDNIDEALKLEPYCIDVSSKVEVDGFKDENKIKEIIRRVRK